MRLKLILSTFVAFMICQVFAAVAYAKNDPVGSQRICQHEVSKKYKISQDAVKVVYRGDDSKGDHIVNYVLIANGQEGITGICLVKIADSTVQIKELDEFPNDNSR